MFRGVLECIFIFVKYNVIENFVNCVESFGEIKNIYNKF